MTLPSPSATEDRLYVLRTRWQRYVADGQFEQFIEFAVAVNSLAEYFNRLRLPGLVRLCEGLENAALAKLGNQHTHPVPQQDILSLQRQIDTLLGSVASSRAPSTDRRDQEAAASTATDIDWIKPRSVWMIAAPEKREMAEALSSQLQFFGFKVCAMPWGGVQAQEDKPLAVLFIPAQDQARPEEFEYIATVRTGCPASQLVYLGVQSAIEPIVDLMRAGIDVTIPSGDQPAMVLNCVLDLVQTNEQEQYRVLVVEDSRVAVALIQRTLAQHGIDTKAINDPGKLLDVLESYHPDLILMDMYMPRFNGVEATRVLRQMAQYSSLPIVYLSGESDVGMQVEALRLGGDQFLMKPFNPVLLAAVVKTRIERFRESRRSTRLDGLTGLLNHTAAKSRLKDMVEEADGALTVAMIDIDHFKAINDTYGHPVGDQVIRGLAWLLKGRLRSIDLIGRYGGEEFMIALPAISPEQAGSVIERIRHDFAALPHAHPGGALYASFSAGIASYPLADTAAALTEAADGALLQAKRLGRNRVEQACRPQ
ncbi:GGDEF domain-containing response regulator [Noviherbaspirillum autotrophicum]|uniref:diguanylate cyclase n=1 Tax=Noviherbaspirillum autotrophicum TaxID=709839 RepID=A0A0C2BNG1_9BURK|nr:diguanylate cyclase [Noviherbaspirillum autotrophicum]KIF82800.1 response regulator receiver protein [Noviherbaspirillum autotrophicum]